MTARPAQRGARTVQARGGGSPLRERLDANAELFGTFVKSPDLNVTEILARAGYDFLIADLEHSTLTTADVAGIVRTADLLTVPVIVRVTPGSLELVGSVLDAGAAGIMITDLRSTELAEQARRAVEYPPSGRRGLAFSHRAASFGLEPAADYLAPDRRPAVIGQIESREGLAVLPDLLRHGSFDALVLGPVDLAASLGHPGDPDHQTVRDALTEAAALIIAHECALGVAVRDGADAADWRRWGASLIVAASDLTLFATAARDQVVAFSALGSPT